MSLVHVSPLIKWLPVQCTGSPGLPFPEADQGTCSAAAFDRGPDLLERC
jgi:hypothetical protein